VGFKLVILLIWAMVPVALGVLVREDIAHFTAASRQQAQACRARSRDLALYTRNLIGQAREVEFERTEFDLNQWQRNWRDTVRAKERAFKSYTQQRFDHCPATNRLLAAQEQRLQDLTSSVSSVARDQQYYIRGEDALAQIEQDIEVLTWQNNYYRSMPGGRGVYFYLQEELARVETRFDAQRREQDRLQSSVATQLRDTERTASQLLRDLEQTDQLLAQDGSASYVDDVRLRWEHFDLRKQVVMLLQRLSAPLPPQP
jgi:hypothetical protein